MESKVVRSVGAAPAASYLSEQIIISKSTSIYVDAPLDIKQFHFIAFIIVSRI